MQQGTMTRSYGNPLSEYLSGIWYVFGFAGVFISSSMILYFTTTGILRIQQYNTLFQETIDANAIQDGFGVEANARDLLAVARIDTQKAVAYYWMGIGAHRQGNLAQAEVYHFKALEYKEDYAWPYIDLGFIANERGDYSQAESYAGKAMEIDPKNAEAHNLLGIVYGETGRKDAAEAEFKQAIELNPDIPKYQSNLERLPYINIKE